MHKIYVMVAEGTGATGGNKYASGEATVMCRSIKKGIRIAHERVNKALRDGWEAQDNPYGGCPVLYVLDVDGVSLMD